MSENPELLEVGRIVKAHGLKGEVVVVLTTNMIEERTASGTLLRAGDQWLKVVSARPHQDRWLYTFKEIGDRNSADLLRAKALYAEPIDDEGEVFVHELLGRRLIDQHGTDHGTVEAIVDNPAADLLELGDGRLVPLNFYVDHDELSVTVDVPAGLLDDEALDARS